MNLNLIIQGISSNIKATMKLFFKRALSTDKSMAIADIISGLVLLLMLYTSLSKLNDYETFRFVLQKSPLLHGFAGIIAIGLPIAELGTALLLFIPATKLKGLYVSLFLLMLFTFYIIYMLNFSPELPCNCGGVLKFLTWKTHIYFNLFFIVLIAQGIILYRKSISRLSSPPP